MSQKKQMQAANAYLGLLKKCLLNEAHLEDEARILYLRSCLEGRDRYDFQTLHDITDSRSDLVAEIRRSRQIGQHPYRKISNIGFPDTMIGRLRLDSLHHCLEHITRHDIPGDLMECGVWRGGAGILMAGYLDIHQIDGRRVLLADSFEGLPEPTTEQDPDLSRDVYPQLAVSLADVKRNFEKYALLGKNVEFIPGWFCDSLPAVPIERLALLRADGDLYSSTWEILKNLYDKVSPGGIVIMDDYGVLPPCARAVTDFFESRDEQLPELHEIDWSGVFWYKA
jgi:hypothetical protein